MSAPAIVDLIEKKLGEQFFTHQLNALRQVWTMTDTARLRLCLYHATGAGKSRTALAAVAVAGYSVALVIAPPVTRPAWVALGSILGVNVEVISHAKFRQDGYQLDRNMPLIVDEFHLLGGQTGKGWKKMDRAARGLNAPLIICSATPSYNDAERVYCVAHVMDPDGNKGGFISFLHKHCTTENNPFGAVPNVTGFQDYKNAEEFLADLPYVHYVEDVVMKQVSVQEVPLLLDVPTDFYGFGYDHRNHRLMASQMEARHVEKRMKLLDDEGELQPDVLTKLDELIAQADGKVVVYSESAVIALAVQGALLSSTRWAAILVTGSVSPKDRDDRMTAFVANRSVNVLVGTATMATGFDGLDKVCDTMIIVDDTDDDAKRQQLMGRILPRGGDTDVSRKQFYRLAY
jgi:superfamily II DNA or RNA helicase